MSHINTALFGIGGLLLSAVVAPTTGVAQSSDPVDDERGGLEEIVVTAQRREQSLQDVPVAVAVYTAEQLEAAQIDTVQGLLNIAPGMTNFVSRGDTTSLSLSLRGVPSNNTGLIADPTVGTYLNGVYLARSSGQGLGLIDMERVEVLTGPQGTLFGRNTIGGALNLTTQRPTDEFEGEFMVKAGNYDTRQVQAIVNAPLIQDKVGLRLVYNHSEHDGYNYNPVLDKRQDWRDTDYVRATLGAALGGWDALTVFDWVDSAASSAGMRTRFVDLSRPANLQVPVNAMSGGTDTVENYIGGDFHRVYSAFDARQEVRNWGVSQQLSRPLGAVKFTSISAYRELRLTTPSDPIGLPYLLVRQPTFGEKQQQFSQEFQVDGNLFGKLDFVAGAIYFRETGGDFFSSTSANFATGAAASVLTDVDNTNRNISLGGFVQSTFHFTQDLRLTAGVRYTEDERRVQWHTTSRDYPSLALRNCVFPPASIGYTTDPATCTTGPVVAKFDYVPWTVVLDYDLAADVLLYGKVSQGFRSGGFPPGAAGLPGFFLPFDEETLTSYEVGVKSMLFGNRVRFNVAAYYSDYEDIQLQSLQGSPPLPTVSNFGDSRIQGGEVELAVQLGELQLRSIAAYADAEYVSGPYYEGVPGQNIPQTPYQFTPEWTFSQNVDYGVPIAGVGTLNLHADYAYRSRVYFAPLLPATPALWPYMSIAGYGLVNASVGLDLDGVPLSVYVSAQNLTDEEYFTSTSDSSSRSASSAAFLGDPRTYAVSVTYRF